MGSVSYFNLRMPVEHRLRPWVRAEGLAWPDLYWTPMSGFPFRTVERDWQTAFLAELAGELAQDGLQPLCFLEATVIQDAVEKAFLSEARDLTPLPGLCWRLGGKPPGPPPVELADQIRNQQRPFSYGLFADGQAFWLEPPDFHSFASRFGGHGGLIVLFAAAVPGADPLAGIPPALFENPFVKQMTRGADLRRELRQLQRLQDPRMAAVKPVLAKEWADGVDIERIIFLVPKLKSMDFFSIQRPLLETVMQTFPVCFFESPPDEGVLLASALPFADRLAALMTKVRSALRNRTEGGNQ